MSDIIAPRHYPPIIVSILKDNSFLGAPESHNTEQ
jgi:hypothetical protein